MSSLHRAEAGGAPRPERPARPRQGLGLNQDVLARPCPREGASPLGDRHRRARGLGVLFTCHLHPDKDLYFQREALRCALCRGGARGRVGESGGVFQNFSPEDLGEGRTLNQVRACIQEDVFKLRLSQVLCGNRFVFVATRLEVEQNEPLETAQVSPRHAKKLHIFLCFRIDFGWGKVFTSVNKCQNQANRVPRIRPERDPSP